MPANLFCKESALTRFIEKTIQHEIKEGNPIISNELFSTGQLTQCPRRIIYRLNNRTHKDINVCDLDQSYKKYKYIDLLLKDKSIALLNRNLTITHASYNLYGFIDAILKIKEEKVVFMFKLMPLNKFCILLDSCSPPRSDIIEIMTNMWVTEIPHGLLCYEEPETFLFKAFHIKPYKPILKSVFKKCEGLVSYKILEKIPDKPYQDKSAECEVCEYKARCWLKEKE